MAFEIDVTTLAPEERDYVSQLGKISRPFWHDPSKLPYIRRVYNIYNVLTLAAREWDVVGVDMSAWQGECDFSLLSQLASFVLIRYLYGNDYFDPRAPEYVQGCVDYKLPYGGYGYVKPGKSYDKQTSNLKLKYDEFSTDYQVIYPMVDFEETGGYDKNTLNNWMQKYYMRLCSAFGYGFDKDGLKHFMTYTSPGFLDTKMPLTDYIKWTKLDVAHWTTAPEPIRPKEWSVPDFPWIFWQDGVYDSTGYGVQSAKIDHQRYWGSKQDFANEFGVAISPPTTPTVPAYIKVNVSSLNVRVVATDSGNTPIAVTYYGKVWKTTGKSQWDTANRGWWLEVSDDHGQQLWLAGWLCKDVSP